MFTIRGLKEKDIQAPPVRGCRCTYCNGMRVRGVACQGHGSQPSHRLAGGDERHNPENKTRLLLKKIVTSKQFKEYTKERGGATLSWKGKSGLWYSSGRTDEYDTAGHFVQVYNKTRKTVVAALCVPVDDDDHPLPLAGIVMSHYLASLTDETSLWEIAAVEYYEEESVPKKFRKIVDKKYGDE